MSLGGHADTIDMEVQGDAYIEESDELQSPVYQLSQSFLTGQPYAGTPVEQLPDDVRYIIECALKAGRIIDEL